MGRMFTINFWVQTLISTFITMICIYIIKQITCKVNVPVISEIAQGV